MSKKEFFELLHKFKNGHCSEAEEKLLYKFCEEIQQRDFGSKWNLTEKEIAKARLLRRINSTIKTDEETKKRFNFRLASSLVAVVVVGLLAVFYFQNTFSYTSLPKGEVILKMQDGSIKVLKEKGSKAIFVEDGEEVITQDGDILVYKNNSTNQVEYNTLEVPFGKKFNILLSDGTKVNLNSGSSLTYPVHFVKGKQRKVFVKGEAYFDVAKDSLHTFIVSNNDLQVSVLGTKFNFASYDEDKSAEVILVEGSVELLAKGSKNLNPILLTPRHKARLEKNIKTITISPIVPSLYTSWMKGQLVYRDMPFENILQKLERHYNVDIIIKNRSLAKERFSASFDNITIDKVFEALKQHHGINYEISGKTIIID